MSVETRELYYITHIDNLPSILKRGIFSHENIEVKGLKYTPIYDKEIISRRKEKTVPKGRSLWSFANLYFNPRNPMLYRLRCEGLLDDLVVLGVSRAILEYPNILVTTGNAATEAAEILPPSKPVITQIVKETDREWWYLHDGSKRKIMAECLVPDLVPAEYIKSIYTPSYDSVQKILALEDIPAPTKHQVIHEPYMFFNPSKQVNLTDNLSLMLGDMFFSRMHTLTVSVNTVKVMGKGVASRAKYQFPDVYVEYQEACRSRRLKMGKPVLYKRETSIDLELADEPSSLKKANLETWFLLFATKRDWRDRADINGIEKGLQWLVKKYDSEGIRSLAIPALGCGLGRLEWRNVGPLLVKYLSTLDIPVSIYLPVERKISDKLLTKDFLLSR
mgnify:CR=1 FL=1